MCYICIGYIDIWNNMIYNNFKERSEIMAQSTFSIRMEDELKKEFDQMCSDFGMSMSTAITVFAKAVVRERKIPFEITASEPFFTDQNIKYIMKSIEEYNTGDFDKSKGLVIFFNQINDPQTGKEKLQLKIHFAYQWC